MFRLLALDIDGTLLRSDRGLSSTTRHALQKARQAGLEYTIVTGRQWSEARPIYEKLDIRLPIVCHNGAHILNPRENRDLLHLTIPIESATVISDRLLHEGVMHYAYVEQKLLVPRIWYRPLLWGSRRRVTNLMSLKSRLRWMWEARRYLDIVPVDDMGEQLRRGGHDPSAITAIGGVEQALSEMPEGTFTHIDLIRNDAISWNLSAKGVTKQHGLSWLCQHLGIEQHDVVAVGDNYNDIAMLDWAGLGVAMGNAPDAVRQAAGYVTLQNDDEGIAALVDRLLSEDPLLRTDHLVAGEARKQPPEKPIEPLRAGLELAARDS